MGGKENVILIILEVCVGFVLLVVAIVAISSWELLNQ